MCGCYDDTEARTVMHTFGCSHFYVTSCHAERSEKRTKKRKAMQESVFASAENYAELVDTIAHHVGQETEVFERPLATVPRKRAKSNRGKSS
jgi:hypothetical protein